MATETEIFALVRNNLASDSLLYNRLHACTVAASSPLSLDSWIRGTGTQRAEDAWAGGQHVSDRQLTAVTVG